MVSWPIERSKFSFAFGVVLSASPSTCLVAPRGGLDYEMEGGDHRVSHFLILLVIDWRLLRPFLSCCTFLCSFHCGVRWWGTCSLIDLTLFHRAGWTASCDWGLLQFFCFHSILFVGPMFCYNVAMAGPRVTLSLGWRVAYSNVPFLDCGSNYYACLSKMPKYATFSTLIQEVGI
jgi:hypothetical protein